MSRPHKNSKTVVYYFRQKVPADLRALGGKTEAVRSLRTKDPEVAKVRFSEEALKQANIWQSQRAVPSALPHKRLMALVGRYRMDLDATLEDEPGEPAIWEQVQRVEAQFSQDPEALELWAGSTADTLCKKPVLLLMPTAAHA